MVPPLIRNQLTNQCLYKEQETENSLQLKSKQLYGVKRTEADTGKATGQEEEAMEAEEQSSGLPWKAGKCGPPLLSSRAPSSLRSSEVKHCSPLSGPPVENQGHRAKPGAAIWPGGPGLEGILVAQLTWPWPWGLTSPAWSGKRQVPPSELSRQLREGTSPRLMLRVPTTCAAPLPLNCPLLRGSQLPLTTLPPGS